MPLPPDLVIELERIKREHLNNGNGKSDAVRLVRIGEVEERAIRWLWRPYLAHSFLNLVEGDPGRGKSFFSLAVASAVTGGSGPRGFAVDEPGNVLLCSAEDPLAEVIKPRLASLGADLDRVIALDQPITFDPAGIALLRSVVVEHDIRLVIVDNIYSTFDVGSDIHRANVVLGALQPLAKLAADFQIAVVAHTHLSKSRGGGDALMAALGSVSTVGTARSVLYVALHPDDPTKRVVAHVKTNLSELGPTRAFRIEGHPDDPDRARFYWLDEEVPYSADEVLAANIARRETRRDLARKEAVSLLRRELAHGPRLATEIERIATEHGISRATLRRAKEDLGVVSNRLTDGNGARGPWYWMLPDAHFEEPDAHNLGSEHLAPDNLFNSNSSNNLTQMLTPTDEVSIWQNLHTSVILTDEKPEGEENSFRDNNLALRESIRDPDAHFEEPDAHVKPDAHFDATCEHLGQIVENKEDYGEKKSQMLTSQIVSIWPFEPNVTKNVSQPADESENGAPDCCPACADAPWLDLVADDRGERAECPRCGWSCSLTEQR